MVDAVCPRCETAAPVAFAAEIPVSWFIAMIRAFVIPSATVVLVRVIKSRYISIAYVMRFVSRRAGASIGACCAP